MSDVLHAVASGVRLSIFFGCSGAIFALGIISVSRWLKWAPINITVNVNTFKEADGATDHGDVP
jgi:hypothetical protein